MKKRQVIGIVGQAGSGKSFLANKLSQKFGRVFIIDADEDFTGHVCYNFFQVKKYFDYVGYDVERFRIVCRFSDEDEVNKIFEFAWSMQNCLIVCDEFEFYVETKNEHFSKILFQGRHREISMIVIGQRFVQFDTRLRSTFTSLISFRQFETLDLIRAENFGFDPEELKKLEQFKYSVLGNAIEL